jgi:hypothetical protein
VLKKSNQKEFGQHIHGAGEWRPMNRKSNHGEWCVRLLAKVYDNLVVMIMELRFLIAYVTVFPRYF